MNVKPEGMDDWLAESLLHESMHHCQGMFEVTRPFILDHRLVHQTQRYPSPWTGADHGADLTAKSLLAACFVWYAIAMFWERADKSGELPGRRAMHGFTTGDPASMIATFGDALDEDVPNAVAELQADVRRR